jgi:hypothetical protein
MPKKRTAAVDPLQLALAPETVDVLLDGWRAQQTAHSADPRSDPLEPFTLDLAAVWRQHRPLLLAEWRRRGGRGQPWGRHFDAPGPGR